MAQLEITCFNDFLLGGKVSFCVCVCLCTSVRQDVAK